MLYFLGLGDANIDIFANFGYFVENSTWKDLSIFND